MEPCASVAPNSAGGDNNDEPTRHVRRRDVVGAGMKRFEVGLEAPEQLDFEQVSEHVICVLGGNPSSYTLNGTNCYLVGTGKRRLLIDNGDDLYGSDLFLSYLEQAMETYGIEGLSGIIITHLHRDHYGNTHRVQQKYGPVPVYSGDADLSCFYPFLQGLEDRGGVQHYLDSSTGQPFWNPKAKNGRDAPPLPEGLTEWVSDQVDHFSVPGVTTIAEKAAALFYFQYTMVELVQSFEKDFEWHRVGDNFEIRTEGATLRVLKTPGHSVDHIALLMEEEHALFSGDHVLGWGTTLVNDMHDYMSTLRRMLDLRPTRLYPGHGALIEDGVDLLVRYLDHREQREEQAWQALQRCAHPMTISELIPELYPHTPENHLWMAKHNIEKLFRKFCIDGSAAAWHPPPDGGTDVDTLVPYELPKPYTFKRIPENVRWGAHRSLALARGATERPAAKL